ncbi:MAG: T9SS type A sorting domain-containing protein [Saprospiraceae bacterium]
MFINIGTESSSLDVPLFQITTDTNGFYSITVPSGEYYWVQLNALPLNCQACPDFPFSIPRCTTLTVDIGLDCQGGHLNGLVFFDENEDCLLDAGENGIGGWTLAVTQQGTTDTTVYDAVDFPTGLFSIFAAPGTYDLILTPPSSVLLPCQPIQTVTVDANGSSPQILFPLMPLSECPQLFVDIGSAGIRPCFNTDFYVQYCNWGTVTATDAYIEVTLPPAFSFISSEISGTALPGNVWSFPVGDVASGECQTFSLTAFLDCDEQVGLTYCTEAHAFPDTSCVDTSMFWDGSSVEVFANCDGDSVTLTIMNNGWGNMSQPLEFIVVEDNVLIRDSTFQLQSGNSTDLVVFPNGATILLQAQQSFGNPNMSNPIVLVEGCGGDSISIGFVTQYPQGDDDFYLDIDCRESVAAFDPNIKEAQPKGITDAHFITPETDLDYQITFQNLGTAPALEVVILDTLSQFLDTATFRAGVASHDYSWELLNGHILKFTFENINLPQANIDSINSIGFVKYHIEQINGNIPGTAIENRAGIYFDFNTPIITNTVMHQIPEPELFKTEIIYLCSGEMFNNEIITENTVFYDTIRYAFFDSIFIQEINVLPVYETNLEGEICEGEEFIFNGETLVNTGVYTAELFSQNGCDSLVILNLEVFPDLSEMIDTTVIAGSELFGIPIFTDTTIVQNMTDQNGCFYTLTYNVETIVSTIDISSNIEINISPNPSNGNFVIQGKIPKAGKVSATLFNIYGQAVEDIFRDEYLNKNFTKKIIGDKIPAGTYYLIFKGDGWNTTKRIVIF